MWRAFFFAIGIVLIILGLESLVVHRFSIARDIKLPSSLAGVLDESGAVGNPGNVTTLSPNVAPPANYYGGAPGQSRFGPSRLSTNFGNDQFFQAANSSNQPNGSFSLAGFGQNRLAPNAAPANRNMRILKTRDWMPWSLVAAGAIIVLYTNSLTRRDNRDED